MRLSGGKEISLENRIKQDGLSVDDLQRVNQIPGINKHLKVPFKGMPSASDAVNELINVLKENKQLNLGIDNYTCFCDDSKSFKPVHRLVAAVAYALKQEIPAKIRSVKEEGVIIAGDECFKTKESLKRSFKNYDDPFGFYYFNDKLIYILLSNDMKIRSCFTRMLDAPSDVNGHIQRLGKDNKIIEDMEYFSYASP